MPTYCYECPICGAKAEIVRPRPVKRKTCANCPGYMNRDYHAEAVAVYTDPDVTTADIERNVADRAKIIGDRGARGNMANRALSRSLARTPGVRKMVGKDGKRYAVFANKADRRKTLARLGIQSD